MTAPRLHISGSLSLPLDFVTSTQAILAKKGSGKSYTASVQAEELLDAKQQIVVVDPTGAWWGLRSSVDGRSEGYSIAVLGGEHGDVALEATAGEVIGEAIASDHFSAILDLSLFRKAEANRFMGVFLETLYRKNREALHVFIDEADTVAPQKPFGDEARTLGATEDIVRRGRIRGIGCTLITQRPQVLNKNVLSQVDMLTALRMNHPKDIGAIEEWVAVHGDPKQAKAMIESLPSLPIGEAWIWAPATDLFRRVAIRRRHTFDSGRTPKSGEQVSAPKSLAKVDIARLGKTIAATVEQAKANDPKALKARVAELERQLAAKPGAAPARVETKVVERAVLKDGQLARAEKLMIAGGKLAMELLAFGQKFAGEAEQLRAAVMATRQPAPTSPAPARPAPPAHVSTRSVYPGTGAAKVRELVGGSIPVGEAATLRALIQYTSGLRREQLTVLTGYKRSTRDAYIARLREKGLLEVAGDVVRATREGVQAMPDAEPLPVGEALQNYWLDRLPEGERAILAVLLGKRGADVSRDEASETTGYKRSTRDSYLSRLAAKELVIDVGRGLVKASPTLFEVSL